MRVEANRQKLSADSRFEFCKAHEFPERYLARLHPYHDFIKWTSQGITGDEEAVYPDLFPGEGAHLPRRFDNPLWGGLFCTDAVTPIMRRTYEVARGSAEAAMTGASLLLESGHREVYALCRPSGHHAGPRVFGGYCYFNNAATAAELLSPSGKVAILDIDYHHGNGTQEFFEDRRYVFTASIHGDPQKEYPYYWGYADEKGKWKGKATNLTVPLEIGSGKDEYLLAVEKVKEAIESFGPDYFIISAGFDTFAGDPIGGFKLAVEDYEQVGRSLGQINKPVLICQEGGYNLDVLGQCVYGFLDGLLSGRK